MTVRVFEICFSSCQVIGGEVMSSFRSEILIRENTSNFSLFTSPFSLQQRINCVDPGLGNDAKAKSKI